MADGDRPLAGIAVTAAAAILLRFAIEAVPGWGTETHALDAGPLAGILSLGDVLVARADLAALLFAGLIGAGLYAAGRTTRLGLALRAHIEDPRAAALSGVSGARMRDLAWLLAGALAAVAGVLAAPSPSCIRDWGRSRSRALRRRRCSAWAGRRRPSPPG